MCRWFAYISPTETCLLEDVLITPSHSICKQINSSYLPGLLTHHPDIKREDIAIAARNNDPNVERAQLNPAARQLRRPPVISHERLADFPTVLNIDGFGVGYYTPSRSEFTPLAGPRPILFKSAQPALRDPNFRALCENTATLALFAHIRSATSTPVVSVNNHPFAFGRHLTMHNGLIGDFERFAHQLCGHMHPDALRSMAGRTDSEHFAALYMTCLDTRGEGQAAWERSYPAAEMRAALQKALDTLFRVQLDYQKSRTGGEGYKFPASSMNVAVTDGESMVAMRVHNHAEEEPPTLYYSTTAGVSLNRKFPGSADGEQNEEWEEGAQWTKSKGEHGRHVIVASEPSTEDDEAWTLIPKNSCVMVHPDGTMAKESMKVFACSEVKIVFNPDEKAVGHMNAKGDWISS